MRRLCDRLGLPPHAAMLRPLDDPAARMTDGIGPDSRMIGDPKFHRHQKIDPAVAARWKSRYDSSALDPATASLAARLGYADAGTDGSERIEFEI